MPKIHRHQYYPDSTLWLWESEDRDPIILVSKNGIARFVLDQWAHLRRLRLAAKKPTHQVPKRVQ
jgi:hypothetical protein